MGEETGSETPFQFFTDHHGALADAVREGRRREFASFAAFSDPMRREAIPDPNAPQTFERSRPAPDAARGSKRMELYRRLLEIRHKHIVPRLNAAKAVGAKAVGALAVLAQWQLGNAVLTLATNLGSESRPLDPRGGRLIFETEGGADALKAGRLAPFTTIALLE
jgi:1,4-alpha-glucan branching enzyme